MIFNQRVVQLTGRRIALTPPVNFTATPGNEQVSLTWEDPGDATSGGVVVAEWEFTQIVRKVGSPPVNQTDGTIVTISDVKNQYLSEPFVDTGLTNGTTYYYGAFACSKAGAWSDGAFAGAIPVQGTALGSFAEGTLVKIKENGTPVEFYVAKQGYEPTLNGPNRVLMVRKDVYDLRVWNSTAINTWATSTMLSWLNGDYKGVFSSNVQGLMGSTTYQYTPSNGSWNVTTRFDSVFLLSLAELGKTAVWANVEGSALPIASTLLVAHDSSGSEVVQWTRTPDIDGNNHVGALASSGTVMSGYCSSNYGSRPCFTLPKNALVDPDMNLIESSDIPPIETPLGDLAEGTLITIQESGAPVEFYVACQNYEEGLNGAGRVLMVRKDVQSNQAWDVGRVNAYATSDIDAWFNGTYKNTLSNAVQTMIGTTQFYYTPGNGKNVVAVLNRAIFALSVTEFGENADYANEEGSVLTVSNILKIPYFNGVAITQWTRSPKINTTFESFRINQGGYLYFNDCNFPNGARPCFTLPSTALVDGNLALIEEV